MKLAPRKCYFCLGVAVSETTITLDNKQSDSEKIYLCKKHNAEYQAIKKKNKGKL